MPIALDPTIRGLNDCDGCAGISVETPLQVYNRPGLNSLAYRVGTHGRFLESMLARLSSTSYPAFRALRTRSRDDLTIAFLDACAAVDDGLTFYTERFANEWYVRTAAERVSLVQMARLIGYEPRPGVAATGYLAFTIEDSPGTPDSITIEDSTRVMSIPGKDELPQTFETSAPIEARALWNAMKLRTRQPQPVTLDMKTVIVRGLETGLRPGDRVLILTPGADNVISATERKVKQVVHLTPDPLKNQTEIELQETANPTSFNFIVDILPFSETYTALTSGAIGGFFQGKILAGSDVTALQKTQGWSESKLVKAINAKPPKAPPGKEGVYAFRQHAAIFGHNSPTWATLPQIVQGQTTQIIGRVLKSLHNADTSDNTWKPAKWQYSDDWDNRSAEAIDATGSIDLDNLYPQMTQESWVALEAPGQSAKAFAVDANQELTRSDFTLSVKVSRLRLSEVADLSSFPMRKTTVYGQSEQLILADIPVTEMGSGKALILDQYYPGLKAGQLVIVTGERTDLRGVVDHEVRVLEEVRMRGDLEKERYFTELVFTSALDYTYAVETVTINANVVEATHGETRSEVLGGGSGAVRYQTFTLKQPPLTYISAATPSGALSTLEVRVNNVLWKEVPSLYGRDAEEQVYIVRHEDDGKTRVQFNAPLPSGAENVRAAYRSGIGLPGMVRAGQLSMLPVRPLGVRGVTNPLAAVGAEDRESIEDLRENSPLTVLTLDRLVSLADYENFARAFAGFSKALATFTLDGAQQGVFLTVAGETGVVDEGSRPFASLTEAIRLNSDAFVSVIVKPYLPAYFQIDAALGIHPDYLPELVLQVVHDLLYHKYGFAARHLGQPVSGVEIIAAIQSVPGVTYVDLNKLYRVQPFDPSAVPTLEEVLRAAMPQPGKSRFAAAPAELLTLDDTRPITLTPVKG
jgi:predicted phage baseplate assembly protein